MPTRVQWTEEKIRQIAPNFSSRTDMSRTAHGAYRFASKIDGLLDELFGKKKFVWTEVLLTEEAQKYQSKSDFQKGSGGAYAACVNRFPGLIDTLFDNRIRYWKTEESVLLEAQKYTSRSEFQHGTPGAYKSAAAKFPHILDDLFGESRTSPWSVKELVEEALKYDSRDAFQTGNGAALAFLYRHHRDLLHELFPPRKVTWTEDMVRAEAAKYKTKAEFISGNVGAYGYALRTGIIDDLGFASGSCGFQTTKAATFYLSELLLKNNRTAVLFGITNRAAALRYTKYEQRGMRNKVSLQFQIGADALRLETELRRATRGLTIERGLSPLRDKLGTGGEILTGVRFNAIYTMVMSLCTNVDSVEHHW